MANLPYLNTSNRKTALVDVFGGINKSFRIAENELSDAWNMTNDDYPVLSTRRRRGTVRYAVNGETVQTAAVGRLSSAVVFRDTLVTLTENGYLNCGSMSAFLNIANNKLLKFGNKLYAYPSGTVIDFSEEDGEKRIKATHQFIEIKSPPEGNELDGTVENDETTEENEPDGTVGNDGTTAGFAVFIPETVDGIGKTTTGIHAPTNPNGGDYWYDLGAKKLKIYDSENGWTGAKPNVIRVCVCRVKDDPENPFNIAELYTVFSENDAVFISNTGIDELDSTFVIEKVGDKDDPAIYLRGSIDDIHFVDNCRIEKKMPLLDFAVEHNGRIWGCRYGENADGQFVNEIYASALNDPTNWFRYNGTSQDSYAVSLTSEGEFTAAAVINGYVTFFKEGCFHRIYGSIPSDFQLLTQSCDGVQKGSEKSIAFANGYMFFKSRTGIMVLSDGLPKRISADLGTDRYTDAIGGSDGYKYYISMAEGGDRRLYVYDIAKGLWQCESSPDGLVCFVPYKNTLLALCSVPYDSTAFEENVKELQAGFDNDLFSGALGSFKLICSIILKIMRTVRICIMNTEPQNNIELPMYGVFHTKDKINKLDDLFSIPENSAVDIIEEEDFPWCFETGEIGYDSFYKKYLNKLSVRLQLSAYARCDVFIDYDSSDDFSQLQTVCGDGVTKTLNIDIRPLRCDHFKLRFSGIGDVKLLGIARFYEVGSEL